jgi:hypothetical protein
MIENAASARRKAAGVDVASVAGIDASRRAGWAKYYDTVAERDHAQHNAASAIEHLVLFSILITHHSRLAHDDPLVVVAAEILREVGQSPLGSRLIERMESLSLGFVR